MPYAVTSDEVKLYYEEVGQDTPILFVHEFAGDPRSWIGFQLGQGNIDQDDFDGVSLGCPAQKPVDTAPGGLERDCGAPGG